MGLKRTVFLAAILFTWGTIEALESKKLIPKFAKDAENPTLGLKRTLPFENPKEIKDGSNFHPVPKSLYALACGSYTLTPGTTVVIQSQNYPNNIPSWYSCQWDFQASSPDSRISMYCPVFRLSWSWWYSYVYVGGGAFSQYYWWINDGLSASSTTNSMTIFFSTTWAFAKGFECYVTASVLPTFPSGACKCGQVNTNTRIVGGNPTQVVHKYPWQVALTGANSNRPYCGGSIISDQWILTAAHCVDGESPSNSRIVIGEHNWNSIYETTITERKEIFDFVIYPTYNSTGHIENDIALIKLKTPIAFSNDNKIAPVCLPPPFDLYENVAATVTGWGLLSDGGSMPNELYELGVSTLSNGQCTFLMGNLNVPISMNDICAQLVNNKGFCNGDSGGPLVTAGNAAPQSMVQIGVVSRFVPPCALDYPDIYTRVNYFLDWIATTTSGSTTCPYS